MKPEVRTEIDEFVKEFEEQHKKTGLKWEWFLMRKVNQQAETRIKDQILEKVGMGLITRIGDELLQYLEKEKMGIFLVVRNEEDYDRPVEFLVEVADEIVERFPDLEKKIKSVLQEKEDEWLEFFQEDPDLSIAKRWVEKLDKVGIEVELTLKINQFE